MSNITHQYVPGVRVRLDLTSFFQDKRKKCYYYVDFSRIKLVRDVCNDIKSELGISYDIFVEINECFVPENTDARILYNEDVLKVIYVERGQDKQESSLGDTELDRHSCALQDENGILVLSKPKKRKKLREENKNCDGFGTESEKRVKKREKHSADRTIPDIKGNTVQCNVFSDNAEEHKESLFKPEKSKKYKDKSTKQCSTQEFQAEICDTKVCSTVDFPHVQTRKLDPEMFTAEIKGTFAELESTIQVNKNNNDNVKEEQLQTCEYVEKCKVLEDNKIGKKKRHRRRKRTSKELYSSNNCNSIASSSNIIPKLVSDSQKTPKHIKFTDDDDDDDDGGGGEENEENINNDYKLNNLNTNNEIVISKGISFQASSESLSTNIESIRNEKYQNNFHPNPFIPSVGISSIVEDNSEVILKNFVAKANSMPVIFECKKTNGLISKPPMKNESESIFSKYPLLKNLPIVNDIIAFKKWKMNDNYCPGVSDYISAKVLKVLDDNIITLRILNGHDEFKEPQGKFSVEEEDEEDEDENKKFAKSAVVDIQMNITELLEIRLMFP